MKQLMLWLSAYCWRCTLSSLKEIFDPLARTAIAADLLTSHDSSTIRRICIDLQGQDRNVELLAYLDAVERFHGSLELDDQLPSLYNFKVGDCYSITIDG